MSKRKTKDVNLLFYNLLDDGSLLVEPDDTRAARKAFKRFRHLKTHRRNRYYDRTAQLYVFVENGKRIVAKLRSAGFHLVEGISND